MLIKWLVSTAFGIDPASQTSKPPTPPSSTTPAAPPGPSVPPASSSPPPASKTTDPTPGAPAPSALKHASLDDRPPYPDVLSRRSLRQLGLMLGGAGFLYWSVMISRRAAVRHHLASQLRFFTGHHEYLALRGMGLKDLPHHPSLPSIAQRREPFLALEALGLASLNLMSFAIMAVGGLSWAFDVSELEDLRKYSRRSLARSVERQIMREAGEGGSVEDAEAESDVLEWFGRTFGVMGGPGETGKEDKKENDGATGERKEG
ncbi:hypothetical protein VTJ83DRAFT_1717 [Remersonia thermophila]|uniref:Altered inheritance of mitochondria protein 11 n=1 Tax=Remersonia thermophila TaxID=72144 RepID=A0ABR4DGP0_9PEZI